MVSIAFPAITLCRSQGIPLLEHPCSKSQQQIRMIIRILVVQTTNSAGKSTQLEITQETFFDVDSFGRIFKYRQGQSTGGDTGVYHLRSHVSDRGVPSRSGGAANVTVTFLSDSHLVSVLSAMYYDDFILDFQNATVVNHYCLDRLSELLGLSGNVILQEVVRSRENKAELTFYVLDNSRENVLLATNVISLLLARVDQLRTLDECAITSTVSRVDEAYDSELSFYSDPYCNVASKPMLKVSSGTCTNNFDDAVSARIFCSQVALGQVGIRFYGNVGCNMPMLQLNSSINIFASANAVAIYENTCVGVDVPTLSGVRTVYIQAQCSANVATTVSTTSISEATNMSTIFNSEQTTSSSSINETSTVSVDSGVETTISDDSGIDATTLAFSVVALVIWILLIILALRYRRQRQKLRRAKMMVIAHQGDIAFGTPEPMAKSGDDGFTGGEIDPVTGQVTMFKQSGELENENSMMPGLWGGQRQNPMVMLGMGNDIGDGDSDNDSLGNLSEFEDADFEAFADSLLDDTMDDELFGYNKGGANSEFGRGLPDLDDGNDSLSDFENDNGESSGYLGVGTDIDDFEDLPVSDAIFGQQRDSMVGIKLSGSVHKAVVSQQDIGKQRDSMLSLNSAASFDSLSDEEDEQAFVVAQPTYEAVGQTWTRRHGEK